jgi:hypothetical protein
MTELWRPPQRTEEALQVYAAAEADRNQNPDQYRLETDAVIEKALGNNLSYLSADPVCREGLGVYVESAREEGRLNALGVKTMMATAAGRLKAGSLILQYLECHPEVRKKRINKPVFIIGGWRTGTTLLQRMLASAPNLRGAYPMELSAPWRCAESREDETGKLARGARQAHNFLHLVNPGMKTIHPSGADLPEECVLAMGTDFKNWGFTSTLRCPSYASWLKGQDFASSYQRYADILRMLQDTTRRRWVLKAPAHTAELPSLLAAFPDACIVHLHRDVVETVASSASLFAVFRSTYSDVADPVEVGRFQLDQTALWLDRAMACRENPPKDATPVFLDLAYQDLVKNPIAGAKRIFNAFDIEWTAEVAQSFEVYLKHYPKDKHGRHRYTSFEFGLEPDEIRERLKHYAVWAGLA